MSEQPVFNANQDDPEMQEAYRRARATFKYLWRELTWEYRRIVPGLETSAVKASFNDPGNHPDDAEHMWVGDIGFDGEFVEGTLMNHPNGLRSVAQGDLVSIPLAELEDWMYAMYGRLYGGFSIQAMRGHMPTSERRAHDKAWGFEFGDPNAVEVVPNWDAVKAPKPGVLGKLFGKKPAPTPPGDPEVEHPMSVNMAEKMAEAVAADRDAFLTDTDPRGFTMLHSMALGGSADGVRVLLEAGADRNLRTERGFTAKDLAERMSWPRCVALLG